MSSKTRWRSAVSFKYENPVEAPLMQDVIKYNEYDVKILQKIIEYLRLNH